MASYSVRETLEAVFDVLDGHGKGYVKWWTEQLGVDQSTIQRWMARDKIPEAHHAKIEELQALARQKVVGEAKERMEVLRP